MKRVLVLLGFLQLAIVTVHAQSQKLFLRTDEKNLHQQEKTIKKEMKTDRKSLKRLEGSQVSYQSKQAFWSDFGNIANASWKRTAHFDEAIFVKDGQKMTAYYDDKSNLVGTSMHKHFNELPVSAQRYINQKYSDYKVAEVIFYDDNEANDTDMFLYGSQFEGADNYFVVLKKTKQTIILKVDMGGNVSCV
jgi:hypothetical protein